MMSFTLERFAGSSIGNPYKYKVEMVVQRNGKLKTLAAECDKICPAGKKLLMLPCDGGNLETELDDISINKNVQPTDNRSCIRSNLDNWECQERGFYNISQS